MYDILIKNAWVLDGTGREGFRSDVAISDGKIVKVDQGLSGAATVIDATGLTLTPGFIDSHSHSDLSILVDRDQPDAVEQGITFSVTGQCGLSYVPATRNGSYLSMGEYLEQVSQSPIGSGHAILAGHCAIRSTVMGMVNRAPTPEELSRMEQLLAECLEKGAIGLSFGMTYTPGSYADTEEMIALAKVAKKYDGIITIHLRNEGDFLLESLEEFITVIKASGCRGVVSHHKAADRANWGKVKKSLAMIDKANQEGCDIYLDVYPYCASSTSLVARFLPKQFHPEGTTSALELLDDPEILQKAKKWAYDKWGDDLSWVFVTSCDSHKELQGFTVNELAEKLGIADRYDAVYELIRMSKGRAQACFTMMCEEDIQRILAHPRAMVGADSNMIRRTSRFRHPRHRATFPRVLRKYVLDDGIVPLKEMIRRITSLPAYVYGLPNKGLIREGYDADICIFDPATIRDVANFSNCFAPNEGLNYVLIDGKIVVKDNTYTGIRAGKMYIKK